MFSFFVFIIIQSYANSLICICDSKEIFRSEFIFVNNQNIRSCDRLICEVFKITYVLFYIEFSLFIYDPFRFDTDYSIMVKCTEKISKITTTEIPSTTTTENPLPLKSSEIWYFLRLPPLMLIVCVCAFKKVRDHSYNVVELIPLVRL